MMTRKVLVLQHIDDDALSRFAGFFADAGLVPEVVGVHREPIPDLDGYDMMLVMGGAMQVWQEAEYPWLKAEKAVIADWVSKRQKPYFGICLGHQLLAAALGGEVGLAEVSEIGQREITLNRNGLADPLLAGLSAQVPVMQWHLAEVTKLPQEARSLASSPLSEHQIMAVGHHALSVQFHCEWTLDFIASWKDLPDWRHALDEACGEGSLARMVDEATPAMAHIDQATSKMFANFRALNAL